MLFSYFLLVAQDSELFSLSLADILQYIAIIITVTAGYYKLSNRISLLENQIVRLETLLESVNHSLQMNTEAVVKLETITDQLNVYTRKNN